MKKRYSEQQIVYALKRAELGEAAERGLPEPKTATVGNKPISNLFNKLEIIRS
jgi:hypothetical protein